MRLDIYLTERNQIESRTKAKSLIGDSLVIVNGKIITKPSFEVSEDDEVKIIGNNNPYVSRGGLKLEAAINNFNLDFKDKVVLDIGASTGGFTDCALQHGAKLVYAVDVGSDQLHPSLRSNPKVVSMEKTNVKDLGELPNKIDFVVMDVSFVSIEYLLPFIYKYVMEANDGFVMLIKPQFELGHQKLKNGVVKDSKTHLRVIENIKAELNKYNLGIYKIIHSPILGGDGNKEFLAYVKNGSKTIKLTDDNGMYAFVYLNGNFMGGKSGTMMTEAKPLSDFVVAYHYLDDDTHNDMATRFGDMPKLFGKDFYVILRPALIKSQP